MRVGAACPAACGTCGVAGVEPGHAALGLELSWRSCARNGSRVLLAALAIDGAPPDCAGGPPRRGLRAFWDDRAPEAFWGAERAEELLAQWCAELREAPPPPRAQGGGAFLQAERDEL